ncbi:MAG: hypothetical protein R3D55_06625 [Chloroflexota bacterium]
MDIALFLAFIVDMNTRFTGISIHEWLGIGFGIALIYTCCCIGIGLFPLASGCSGGCRASAAAVRHQPGAVCRHGDSLP